MTEKHHRILTNPIVWNFLKSKERTDIAEGGWIFKLPILIGDMSLDYCIPFNRIDGAYQNVISAVNNGSVFLRPEESWAHVEIDFERKMCKSHTKVLKDLENLMYN